MSLRNYSNTAVPQVLSTSVNATATTLMVSSTTTYPNPSVNPFILTIDRGTANQEVMLCTALTSTTFTVQRGYDGTTAVPHTGGLAIIEHTSCAIDVREPNTFINTPFNSTPTQLNYGDGGSPGTSLLWARGDHGHPHPAPVATFGHMDATSPVFGSSNNLATVSANGNPLCGPVTVPTSGMVVVNWSMIAQAASENTLTDIYIGVGWSTSSGVRGHWPGTSLGSPGTGLGGNWSIMSSAVIDDSSTGLQLPTQFPLAGTWYLTSALWALNPGTAYYFYLLWGSPSTSGNITCNAGGRGAAQNGTWIETITVP